MHESKRLAEEAGRGLPADERVRAFIRVFLSRIAGSDEKGSWIARMMARELEDPTPGPRRRAGRVRTHPAATTEGRGEDLFKAKGFEVTTLFLIGIVHWLHVLGGAVWFGGAFLMAFGVWPVLLRRPAAESHALYHAMERPLGIVFAAAVHTTFWLGLLRATWLGPVQSLDVLLRTAYGHTLLTALVLTIAFMVYGGITRSKLEQRVWDGDHYRPGAASYVARTNVVSVGLLVLIIGCMVAMRFGV